MGCEIPNSTMDLLKNLAGHDAAIFLFRFDLTGAGICFVLNKEIAADMYAEVDEKLQALVQACGEALLRYKRWSAGDTIMDGHILNDGQFEVMLSPGLGKYIPGPEKAQLFQDANKVADLLIAVMDRRTAEEKAGKQTKPFRKPAVSDPAQVKRGQARLGQAKHLQAKLQSVAEGKWARPGRKQLRPEDLPSGVTAAAGYDHRGHCVTFEHDTLGELGRIVVSDLPDKETLIQSEFCLGKDAPDSPRVKEKQRLFGEVVAIVHQAFEGNFPR